MPLHILQLGPYPPPEGGISRNMLAIRDELAASGHRCSIIATSKSSSIIDEPDVFHPSSGMELVRLIWAIKFDVLHLHIGGDITMRVLLLALAATLVGRNRCVLTLHSGGYPQTKKARAARQNSIRGVIFRRFSRIIAVSQPIADVFRRYGVENERMRKILPFSLKQPDPEIAVPADLSAFMLKHSPILLSVGGLEKDYDPLFQIAAMKEILSEFPDAGLLLAGGGSMLRDMEQAIIESGYAENIHLAGNIEHAVTLHLIKAADVLLRITLFDGDAISIREALFLGTPVIATDNGMRPSGVELFKIGDAAGMVRCVRTAIATGKHKPAENADPNSNITKVIELYLDLIGESF